MTLGDYQAAFTYAICRFIAEQRHIYSNGNLYRIRMDYLKRSEEENRSVGGHPRSTHLNRLAVDLVVDVSEDNGETWDVAKDTDDIWRVLHDRWETKYNGSKRILKDLGHFSFEYQGVR